MIDNQELKTYVGRLPGSASFTGMTDAEQDQYIFGATELLSEKFSKSELKGKEIRAVALQVLFTIDNNSTGHGLLRSQGVQSYGTKSANVTFDESTGRDLRVSVDVWELLSPSMFGAKLR